jgi:hypothetical protein
MKNPKWYLNRLSKMSVREIIYRVEHKVKAKADEFFLKDSRQLFIYQDFDLSGLKVFSDYIEGKSLSDLNGDCHINRVLEQADQLLQNRVNIFGQEYDIGDDIDWHLDPKANKRWPLLFWNKVNIRDGFTHGAPKFVWEHNRLYSLPVLGLAFKATKNKEYADKIMQLVSSWVGANPYPYGVNWTSGIEMGVRTANLLWALFFLKDYEFSSVDKKNLNTFFHCHGRQLSRFPSKYSSNNNHAIAEAFGLFIISVFFPFYDKSGQWRKHGQAILERECLRQILPDGGSYEYSTTYLSFVFDFFLLFKVICDRQGMAYNRELDKRLKQSCEYISAIMDSQGNVPNIGDQDSAVLINFGLNNHENFQSILNTGYLLFGNDRFRRDAFPDIKTWMLLCAETDQKGLCEIKASSPKMFRTKQFKESGLGIIRDKVHDREVLFIGNATPLGMPPLYGHGHLDALSIYMSLGGQEVLVDPGTYLYHSGGKWRRYFRSTAAHNTIRINHQELTEQVADFMFGKPYDITGHCLEENEKIVLWTAKHNAYENQAGCVAHERSVVFDSVEGTFEIKDLLESKNEFFVEQFFHFHPDCRVKTDSRQSIVTCGNNRILFSFDALLLLNAFNGNEDPLYGWFSKEFNHIEPCWTIVGQARIAGKQELITKIKIQS